ncbi:rCG43068 [Rattus norvegicus]|uniref:RCG43068 n=1 Tax=Rattus norvegicus TaxID=10116 RepID=A6IW35_RAT|nr:rCG43068 [Rattus norvegicus]
MTTPEEEHSLDPWELTETKPPTNQSIHELLHRQWHMRSRGLTCLASVGEGAPIL